MKGLILSRLAMVAVVMVVLAVQAIAQTAAAPQRKIVVSLQDRKLALVVDGQVVKVYPVAVGKSTTPSPVGTFSIERRVMNPTYSHNGKVVPPGPGNPVGTRWMGLSVHGYGIHGTNEPRSIGKAASHGCIRMAKADLEELYPLVQVGDTVELVGQPNAETAMIFGAPQPIPAATEPATLTAQNQPPANATPASGTSAAHSTTIVAGLATIAITGSW
jgi:hypothetical protein